MEYHNSRFIENTRGNYFDDQHTYNPNSLTPEKQYTAMVIKTDLYGKKS